MAGTSDSCPPGWRRGFDSSQTHKCLSASRPAVRRSQQVLGPKRPQRGAQEGDKSHMQAGPLPPPKRLKLPSSTQQLCRSAPQYQLLSKGVGCDVRSGTTRWCEWALLVRAKLHRLWPKDSLLQVRVCHASGLHVGHLAPPVWTANGAQRRVTSEDDEQVRTRKEAVMIASRHFA